MIKSNLAVVMAERGPYTMKQVAEGTGLRPNTVSDIYHNKIKRIDLETLDKLCNFLKCDTSDILKHLQDAD